mmetsp:Transcript_30226/g.88021  ORF Transcript_30226/g.88021 Transcript_30226/m.88021 type:complete len:202 (+) Transcript_30226:735-1340(+)
MASGGRGGGGSSVGHVHCAGPVPRLGPRAALAGGRGLTRGAASPRARGHAERGHHAAPGQDPALPGRAAAPCRAGCCLGGLRCGAAPLLPGARARVRARDPALRPCRSRHGRHSDPGHARHQRLRSHAGYGPAPGPAAPPPPGGLPSHPLQLPEPVCAATSGAAPPTHDPGWLVAPRHCHHRPRAFQGHHPRCGQCGSGPR